MTFRLPSDITLDPVSLIVGLAGFVGSVILFVLRARDARTIKTLESQLDRTLLVHRVHFETEFKALRRIWTKVTILRRAMVKLEAAVRVVEVVPDDKWLDDHVNAFAAALTAMSDAIFQNEPFIPQLVFKELTTLLGDADAEYTRVVSHRLLPEHSPHRKVVAEVNLRTFTNTADRISALIRQRLEDLTLVPR
jgi:hypothetical protein